MNLIDLIQLNIPPTIVLKYMVALDICIIISWLRKELYEPISNIKTLVT